MGKRVVDIFSCREGDKLALNVVTDSGTTVVTEGTILNKYLIDKIIKMGIRKIYIYEDNENGNMDYIAFKKEYSKNVDAVKNILTELAAGKKLDLSLVAEISNEIKKHIDQKDNIIKFLSTLKAFDQYTFNHSLNVAFYSMLLGKWLGLKSTQIDDLIKAAVLHDIGKVKIPEEILNKKGKLSDEEFEVMKKHPVHGYEIALESQKLSFDILKAILLHHEKENGSGYPLMVRGDKIPLYAKIIAICDVYDAITSERVYKGRMSPFDAFKIIEMDGYELFDVKIMLTFLQNISNYYIGTDVVLNNGDIGQVVYINPRNISYPIVKIGSDYVDLLSNKELKIVSLLN
ncbi:MULTISPECIES: HD-GYP domain-containing protein [Caloramator]|uniref:Metal dependent phosphohydrolase n=1 Tax=Caloramator australicus RC3 TaxID=857293 RepID=I7LJG7_9CLOT|nr:MULTISPECIES: HD-GYP domain-containing protein [Caloramator]MDO6355712.1 HD-GYP domain-containing protein [Caloramator sp. CAR-1]CCJ33702.1 metal dependent phosphohydrolase [Caloramator australicus RC3]